VQKLALIALAGAIGTLARYGLDGFVQQLTNRFPPFGWGIVVVNLLGCLVFGLAASSFAVRLPTNTDVRTIFLTGFVGAFTTFSTYMFETEEMLYDAQWLPAIGYFTIQNVGGLIAMVTGLAVGRLL
jgi:fluoride exporter